MPGRVSTGGKLSRTLAPVPDNVDAVQRNPIVSASYQGGSATTTPFVPAAMASHSTSQHAILFGGSNREDNLQI